tara:strand:- start:1157 stop:1264 length:108 start_codon:yes stop_codon:yes gene_type:complete
LIAKDDCDRIAKLGLKKTYNGLIKKKLLPKIDFND